MEGPAFRKYPALPALLDRVSKMFGIAVRMSGSGSACFALLREDSPVEPIRAVIRETWGESAFVLQTRLG
jgi:4-diphosphocytidyl-2-C-methyl-D-erythritol kinase